VQGVHRLVEVLDLSKSRRKVEELLLQGSAQSWRFKQPEVIVNATRSVCKNPFEALILQQNKAQEG
jgi:hypothetical protein